MIRIAIVEDESWYKDILKDYLNRYSAEKGVEFDISEFSDGDNIVNEYDASYDIILMDIQMKFMDGMSAAEEIRKVDPEVIIIFITNMTQYAIKGYEVGALDYILKPVEYFSFSVKVERAIEKIRKNEGIYLSLQVKDGVIKLPLKDILYVESSVNNLIYHTYGETISVRSTIKEFERRLYECMEKSDSPRFSLVPNSENEAVLGFFKINKGIIVNLKHVKRIVESTAFVGEDKLPVSRSRRKIFNEVFLKYIGNH